jgi:hypothetical protein
LTRAASGAASRARLASSGHSAHARDSQPPSAPPQKNAAIAVT